MATDIEQLAISASGGDQQALERLLAAVQSDILVRCSRALPNVHDAEEAAQDALLAISASIHQFEGRSKFTTWAYRIVSNRIVDTYRRLKRHRAAPHEIPDLPAAQRTSVIAGTEIDLLEAMEKVDTRFAEPVAMRDLCGLSYDEIALALDIPVGTVKSRVSEGRTRLARHMR